MLNSNHLLSTNYIFLRRQTIILTMGCVKSNEVPDETKTRCGKCLVGKLQIKLLSYDLHSLNMNLERLNDLKVNLSYGNRRLGLELYKFEQEPELFSHVIPIHKCSQDYGRALMVTIQNSKTQHNAFGFVNLDKLVDKRAKEEHVVCCLNYQFSAAGKLVFEASFEELQDYEEFIFQIYQANTRFRTECLNYRVKIEIGEQSLSIDGLQLKNKDIKWHHQTTSAKIPLELVTEGNVSLYSIREGKEVQKIGEVPFSLAAYKDPDNIVNKINEKTTVEDCFVRETIDEQGEIVKKQITGDLIMFIVKKENLRYLHDEPLSPMHHPKTIRRRHILQPTQSFVSLRECVRDPEAGSKNEIEKEQSEISNSPTRRREPVVSMPPLEIYKIIRRASTKKPHFRQY